MCARSVIYGIPSRFESCCRGAAGSVFRQVGFKMKLHYFLRLCLISFLCQPARVTFRGWDSPATSTLLWYFKFRYFCETELKKRSMFISNCCPPRIPALSVHIRFGEPHPPDQHQRDAHPTWGPHLRPTEGAPVRGGRSQHH